MRNMFSSLVKLLGLAQLFPALNFFANVFVSNQQDSIRFSFLLSGIIFLLLSLFLLFFSDVISRLLGVGEEPAGINISDRVLLKTGIVLLGVYLFVTNLPFIFGAFMVNTRYPGTVSVSDLIRGTLKYWVPLLLSVVLILFSGPIVNAISKFDRSAS